MEPTWKYRIMLHSCIIDFVLISRGIISLVWTPTLRSKIQWKCSMNESNVPIEYGSRVINEHWKFNASFRTSEWEVSSDVLSQKYWRCTQLFRLLFPVVDVECGKIANSLIRNAIRFQLSRPFVYLRANIFLSLLMNLTRLKKLLTCLIWNKSFTDIELMKFTLNCTFEMLQNCVSHSQKKKNN